MVAVVDPSLFDAHTVRELGAIIRGDASQQPPAHSQEDTLRAAQEAAAEAKNWALEALQAAAKAIEAQIAEIRDTAGDVLSIEARNAIASCSAAAANVQCLKSLVESGALTPDQARHCVEAAQHAQDAGAAAAITGRAGQSAETFKETAEFKLETFEQIEMAWDKLYERSEVLTHAMFSENSQLSMLFNQHLTGEQYAAYLKSGEEKLAQIEALQEQLEASDDPEEKRRIQNKIFAIQSDRIDDMKDARQQAAENGAPPDALSAIDQQIADLEAELESQIAEAETLDKNLTALEKEEYLKGRMEDIRAYTDESIQKFSETRNLSAEEIAVARRNTLALEAAYSTTQKAIVESELIPTEVTAAANNVVTTSTSSVVASSTLVPSPLETNSLNIRLGNLPDVTPVLASADSIPPVVGSPGVVPTTLRSDGLKISLGNSTEVTPVLTSADNIPAVVDAPETIENGLPQSVTKPVSTTPVIGV